MSPRSQVVLVGAGAGLVAWGVWFYAYTKANKDEFARYAAITAPPLAEAAAMAYLAEHYGLTPDILRRITARAGQISAVVGAFRR